MCLRTSDQIIIKRWFKCRSLICDLIFALRLKIVQEIEKQKLHFAFHCYILMSIKCCFNIILIFKISCNNLWCFLWWCWGADMCFTFHDVRFWNIKLMYYFVTAQSNSLSPLPQSGRSTTPCCWCCSGSWPGSPCWVCSLSVTASSLWPSLWYSDPSTTWASATRSYCWDRST